jgi:hypothetical protein
VATIFSGVLSATACLVRITNKKREKKKGNKEYLPKIRWDKLYKERRMEIKFAKGRENLETFSPSIL